MFERARNYPDLLVPCGMDGAEHVVPVAEAVRGTSYFCPGCSNPLVLREGPMVRKHFAHASPLDERACNVETLLHRSAKALIVQMIKAHMRGDAHLRLHCFCKQCGQLFPQQLPKHTFSSAEEEVPIGEFRADVLAMRTTGAALVIEVRATHAVGEHKAQSLELPWIELDAAKIVSDPTDWRPLNSRGLKKLMCPDCKAEAQKLWNLANEFNVLIPEGADSGDPTKPYLAAIIECYKCERETIVFRWQDAPFAETPPPEPRPRTIKYRLSQDYGGKYWMNCCCRCGAKQGDNYLYLDHDGPFMHLPRREMEQEVQAQKNITNTYINKLLKHI